jgi:hypothetical protein
VIIGLFQGSENCGFFQGFQRIHRIRLTNPHWRFPVRAVKGVESCALARKECNEYDLTAAPLFLIGDHNDWSRWFATGICSPSWVFWVGTGLQKSEQLNLDVKNIFAGSRHITTLQIIVKGPSS